MNSTKDANHSSDPEKTIHPRSTSNVEANTHNDRTSGIDDSTLDGEEVLPSTNKWLLLSSRIETILGIESRGVHRVEPHEQSSETTLSFMQILAMWFSINAAAQNITLTSISQSVYQLGFLDATLCSVFGALLGSIPVAYTAGWGAWSGNRTMICARFSMGWWPVKLCILLNLVVMLGYTMIDAVVAGQILSAVSQNGSLSVVVGIIITVILTWLVTTFGITIFHHYERFAWLPQLAVLFILAGVAGPKFNINSQSIGDPITIIGHRLSFFSVCLSSAATYAPSASDYMVYCHPQIVSRWRVFWAVQLGLTFSFVLTFVLGIGLASGIPNNPVWAVAGAGSGALVVAGFHSLGVFGNVCSVIVALGLISNMVPEIYSSGINFQILGRYPALVPRFVWNTFGLFVVAVCALVGRNNLSQIFTNFLAFMGYWIGIWIAITLEDEFLFRRTMRPRYIWSDWDQQENLPIGLAALVAFCVGWVGAVLCMAQADFVGPLAKLIGNDGGDIGTYVGFCVAGLVYLPLRYMELKRYGR